MDLNDLTTFENELRAAEEYLAKQGACRTTNKRKPLDQIGASKIGGDFSSNADPITIEFESSSTVPPLQSLSKQLAESHQQDIRAILSTERQSQLNNDQDGRDNYISEQDEYLIYDQSSVAMYQADSLARSSSSVANGTDSNESQSESEVEFFYASDINKVQSSETDVPKRTGAELLEIHKNFDLNSFDFSRLSISNPLQDVDGKRQNEDLRRKDINFNNLSACGDVPIEKRVTFNEVEDFINTSGNVSPKSLQINEEQLVAEQGTERERELLPCAKISEQHDQNDVKFSSTAQFQMGNPSPIISDRLAYLAAPRSQLFTQREKQRLLLEMGQLKECTFRPNILKTKSKSLPKPRTAKDATGKNPRDGKIPLPAFPWLSLSPRKEYSLKGKNVAQRLHGSTKNRTGCREKQKAALEEDNIKKVCTFHPKINEKSKLLAASRSEDNLPIHKRLSKLKRSKSELQQRLRDKFELEQSENYSFKPTINEKSRLIAEKLASQNETLGSIAQDKKSATARLNVDAEENLSKRLALQEYYETLEMESQPFEPTINEKSLELLRDSGKPEYIELDFLSRQQHYNRQTKQRREAMEDYVTVTEDHQFRPDVGNAKEVLQLLRPERVSEKDHARVYRLSVDEPKRLAQKKQRLREESNAQYSFKPSINPVSRKLAAHHKPSSDLNYAAQNKLKRFRSRIAMEMTAAEDAECTFRPQLIAQNPPPVAQEITGYNEKKLETKTKCPQRSLDKSPHTSIWQSDSLIDILEEQRKQKTEDLAKKRASIEMMELKECTFQPKTNESRHSYRPRKKKRHSSPVVVRGLGQFLETKERAKQLRFEQEKREQKVFGLGGKTRRSTGSRYTIPKPFNLSENRHIAIKNRHASFKDEIDEKERQECTFTPKTIASQYCQVIQNILGS